MASLEQLGWSDAFAALFAPYARTGWEPGRVTEVQRSICALALDGDEVHAERRHDPAVGDWAVVRRLEAGHGWIEALLPRRSQFSRRAAGSRPDEQVIAANLDTVFLVLGLDGDWNPRRLERYLAAAWDSGAQPVVVLNKADLCADLTARLAEAEAVALGVPVHAVSAHTGAGLAAVDAHLLPGQTVALLGSSGVGKSSLLNRWLGGEVQATQAVRSDDSRGRHTTTHRELFRLPCGALVIDTPGMRELQLWNAHEALGTVFADIDGLAGRCRFGDCTHDSEPGCAVLQAVRTGRLAPERLESWRKLQRDQRYAERREDPLAARAERDRWKRIHKAFRRSNRSDGY